MTVEATEKRLSSLCMAGTQQNRKHLAALELPYFSLRNEITGTW